MNVVWLAAILAVTVALGTVGVSLMDTLRTRSRVRRRVRLFAHMLETEDIAVPVASTATESAPQSRLAAGLDARYPLSGGVRTAAIAAGTGIAACVALVPLLSFFGMPAPLAFGLSFAVSGSFGWSVGMMLESAKRAAFNDRFLTAMEDFQRMVHFGIATGQAFASITAAAEEPLLASLRKVQLDAEFGVPLPAALEREARRVRMSELAMLAAIMATQARTGGNLSEAVSNLAGLLRERLDNRARIKSSTAESRVTLIILSAVPFLAIAIQSSLQPEILSVLLGEARHLLGIGGAMIVGGLVVSWLIIRSAQR